MSTNRGSGDSDSSSSTDAVYTRRGALISRGTGAESLGSPQIVSAEVPTRGSRTQLLLDHLLVTDSSASAAGSHILERSNPMIAGLVGSYNLAGHYSL